MNQFLVALFERAGGARPFALKTPGRRIALGLWWMVLFFLIYVTIGRATRFIYVDF